MPQKQQQKQIEAEAVVEKLVCGGLGLVRHPKLGVCFVDQVLPGEHIYFSVAKNSIEHKQAKFHQAKLQNIAQPSNHRALPRCSHYASCGGCNWQHIQYQAQIPLKQQIVIESLQRFTGQDYSPLQLGPVMEQQAEQPSNHERGWAYRQRAKFFWQQQKNYYGFCQRSSNHLVAVPQCLVIDPKISMAVNSLTQARNAQLYAFANQHSCFLDNEEFLYEWNGLQFRSKPCLFFQSNAKVLPLLLARLQSSLVDILSNWRGPFFDLYAGIGLFSLCLGVLLPAKPKQQKRFAVERNTQAFGYLQRNLTGQKFHCIAKDVGVFLKQAQLKGSFVFVDPPRNGLSDVVAQQLNVGQAQYILYLSCDAASFARDIGRLCHNARANYSLEYWYLVDFYPQTHHIETLALLKRKA